MYEHECNSFFPSSISFSFNFLLCVLFLFLNIVPSFFQFFYVLLGTLGSHGLLTDAAGPGIMITGDTEPSVPLNAVHGPC